VTDSDVICGQNVQVDPSSSVNFAILGDNVKIARNCFVFGSKENILEIGRGTYIGMNSMVNGYSAKVKIGEFVSIAQNVYIMADSGPNASEEMQKIFPIEKGGIVIGDHCWIGNGSSIMPGVNLGSFVIVGANSLVKDSFPDFSILGGTPAKIIRMLTKSELDIITSSFSDENRWFKLNKNE
jgi:acetyltransferase-like isoleucine patch superfamily enzyme